MVAAAAATMYKSRWSCLAPYARQNRKQGARESACLDRGSVAADGVDSINNIGGVLRRPIMQVNRSCMLASATINIQCNNIVC